MSPSRSAGVGDERILSYHDATLLRSDLDILSTRSFLNDRIIHLYFTHLSRSLPSSALLLPPSLSFLLSKLPPGELPETLIAPLDLPSRALILFPVNDNPDVSHAEGGTHWSLLAYFRPDGVFVHHDSSAGYNSGEARRLYRAVRGCVGGEGEGAALVEGPTPQQGNGYDCGVYAMAVAGVICGWWKAEEKKGGDGGGGEDKWFGVLREEVDGEKARRLRGEILGLVRSLMVGPEHGAE